MSDPSAGPRPSWRSAGVVVALLAMLAVIVLGVATAPPTSGDRAQALASRLRCPVCQSVSVAESRSDMALAMQDRIDELIDAGATDEEIIDHFVGRYGDWVLLDPPASGPGLTLWLLPAVALAGGAVVAARLRRRRTATGQVSPEWRRRVRTEVGRFRAREGEDRPW